MTDTKQHIQAIARMAAIAEAKAVTMDVHAPVNHEAVARARHSMEEAIRFMETVYDEPLTSPSKGRDEMTNTVTAMEARCALTQAGYQVEYTGSLVARDLKIKVYDDSCLPVDTFYPDRGWFEGEELERFRRLLSAKGVQDGERR